MIPFCQYPWPYPEDPSFFERNGYLLAFSPEDSALIGKICKRIFAFCAKALGLALIIALFVLNWPDLIALFVSTSLVFLLHFFCSR